MDIALKRRYRLRGVELHRRANNDGVDYPSYQHFLHIGEYVVHSYFTRTLLRRFKANIAQSRYRSGRVGREGAHIRISAPYGSDYAKTDLIHVYVAPAPARSARI